MKKNSRHLLVSLSLSSILLAVSCSTQNSVTPIESNINHKQSFDNNNISLKINTTLDRSNKGYDPSKSVNINSKNNLTFNLKALEKETSNYNNVSNVKINDKFTSFSTGELLAHF